MAYFMGIVPLISGVLIQNTGKAYHETLNPKELFA